MCICMCFCASNGTPLHNTPTIIQLGEIEKQIYWQTYVSFSLYSYTGELTLLKDGLTEYWLHIHNIHKIIWLLYIPLFSSVELIPKTKNIESRHTDRKRREKKKERHSSETRGSWWFIVTLTITWYYSMSFSSRTWLIQKNTQVIIILIMAFPSSGVKC